MEQKIKNSIMKYALQNAVKYNGKANTGAIIGKLFAENPALKEKAGELGKEITRIVQQVNHLGLEKQRKKLAPFVAGKFSEIKHLLRQLQSLLGELRKADSQSDNKRLQQIVSTAKSNAERQLAALVEKLQSEPELFG